MAIVPLTSVLGRRRARRGASGLTTRRSILVAALPLTEAAGAGACFLVHTVLARAQEALRSHSKRRGGG